MRNGILLPKPWVFCRFGAHSHRQRAAKKSIGLPKATTSHFPIVQKTSKTLDKCIDPLNPGCSSTLTHRWVLQTAHSTIYYLLALFFSFVFQRWQRHTLLQFLACVLDEANCKCVWLLALAYSFVFNDFISIFFLITPQDNNPIFSDENMLLAKFSIE